MKNWVFPYSNKMIFYTLHYTYNLRVNNHRYLKINEITFSRVSFFLH